MWKRRAEIAVLALLIAIAGAGARPHVHVSAPTVDLAGLFPERIDTPADLGRVAVGAAILLLD